MFLFLLWSLCKCSRKWFRGCDSQLTWALGQAFGGSSPPQALGCTLCPPFPPRELFSGGSLERVGCCWDPLESVRDQTPVKPLHKLVRFWWADAKICLSGVCLKRVWCVNFLTYETRHLPVWSGCPCLCFFRHSLPSLYGGSFQILPRKLLGLWINNIAAYLRPLLVRFWPFISFCCRCC